MGWKKQAKKVKSQSATFDLMEKRHHVIKYKPEPVPEKIMKELLYNAWKISPSKQNMMPYHVNVLGPNRQAEKDKIYHKVVDNHKFYNKLGLSVDTEANPKMKMEYEFKKNPSYYHLKYNSHLLVYSQRVVPKPNKYYQRMVREQAHYAEQCELDQVEATAESTSFEIGLFASNLTALCIEKGIDVSFTACFSKSRKHWKDTPYAWYDKEKQVAKIHSLMSIGYGDYYRYQWLKSRAKEGEDIKPQPDEIIKWI
tara:strand:+ start:827 stop:1588 length:762 start_codon:yes stop_codon:yes gene_type:complete